MLRQLVADDGRHLPQSTIGGLLRILERRVRKNPLTDPLCATARRRAKRDPTVSAPSTPMPLDRVVLELALAVQTGCCPQDV